MRNISYFGSIILFFVYFVACILFMLGFLLAYKIELHWIGPGIPELTETNFVLYSIVKLTFFISALILATKQNKNSSMNMLSFSQITMKQHMGFLLIGITFFFMGLTFSEKSIMLIFRILYLISS